MSIANGGGPAACSSELKNPSHAAARRRQATIGGGVESPPAGPRPVRGTPPDARKSWCAIVERASVAAADPGYRKGIVDGRHVAQLSDSPKARINQGNYSRR